MHQDNDTETPRPRSSWFGRTCLFFPPSPILVRRGRRRRLRPALSPGPSTAAQAMAVARRECGRRRALRGRALRGQLVPVSGRVVRLMQMRPGLLSGLCLFQQALRAGRFSSQNGALADAWQELGLPPRPWRFTLVRARARSTSSCDPSLSHSLHHPLVRSCPLKTSRCCVPRFEKRKGGPASAPFALLVSFFPCARSPADVTRSTHTQRHNDPLLLEARHSPFTSRARLDSQNQKTRAQKPKKRRRAIAHLAVVVVFCSPPCARLLLLTPPTSSWPPPATATSTARSGAASRTTGGTR